MQEVGVNMLVIILDIQDLVIGHLVRRNLEAGD